MRSLIHPNVFHLSDDRHLERFLAMYDANEQEFNVGHIQVWIMFLKS